MPKKSLDILFPSAGIERRFGLSMDRRAPYPAVWACNTRLEDELTNRLRGGSFTPPSAGTKDDPVYRNRSITFSERRISASRVGNHSDFSFASDASDQLRPRRFQLSEAVGSGGTVITVIPHKDQFLLGFTATETWVLAGDPNGGTLRRVSDQVGIIGASAWCVNHDTVYFMSSLGLYSVQADGSGLRPVSEDKIPEDLTGITDSACVLDYRHSDRGVFIHLTSGLSWFYDTARDQFWPFTLDSTDSHVLLGPFRLGSPDAFGRVLNLHGVVASGSDDVIWRIVTGDSAEEAAANGKAAITASLAGNSFTSYVKAWGTWEAGRAHMAYPRTRGVSCCLWLSSEGTWAFESVSMSLITSGQWR